MDPAVIAAVVATPTALIAAGAAYAAGRRQALGAQRGPVDAVRRQHQRDAYAAFLTAANTYADATDWSQCTRRARQEITDTRGPAIREAVELRAREMRFQAAPLLDAVRSPLAVVSLEGPAHVAELAQRAREAAFDVGIVAARAARTAGAFWETKDETLDRHRALKDSIEAFTVAARDHLNGEST
ncbi:hypothetical protein ACFW96_38035 [Streptomyces gardneri]|uniref:hypothetical protein n=1 Tax=Streptomyces gardneri TaxID=66892 RepID=UPI0036B8C41B